MMSSMFMVFRLSWLISVDMVVLYYLFVHIAKSVVRGGKEGNPGG